MELKAVKDEFDHVTKKQKLCPSKCHDAIQQIAQEIKHVLVKLQSAESAYSQPDHMSVLTELKTKLKEMASMNHVTGAQKELNQALSRFPKALEKTYNPDISKAYRNVDFDIHTVNQIIASHLYRQGMFDVGDCFTAEAQELEAAAMKSPFIEMYSILEAMKCRNLEPALDWAVANCEKLKQNGSDIELKLRSLQYIEILQKQGKEKALKYAREFISPFASSHMAEIQKLMVCLLWAEKLESSPYPDMLSPTNWDKLAVELTRQFCYLLGQSFESPLSVTVAAGGQALPTLLKLMNVMTGKKREWQSLNQLPVPVDLSPELQFHSIFVCPVSWEQATDENPPMLLPCGHVLCKQSIMKLSKNSTKTFKCSYCPSDIDASHCKQLHF